MSKQPRVSIVWASIPLYRVPFYEQLREILASKGVQLDVFHGWPEQERLIRGDTTSLPWAHEITNHRLVIRGTMLIWQTGLRRLRGSDLVILEQGNKFLSNLAVMLWGRLPGGPKTALWGHGFTHWNRSAAKDRFKAWQNRQVSWWFAYTKGAADLVEGTGFPRDRITIVQNSIDTRALVEARRSWTPEALAEFRREHGIGDGPMVLYMTGIDPKKRPEFVVAMAERMREQIPDLQLLVLGAGPSQHVIEEAAARHDWIHYPGAIFGNERVPWVAQCDLMVHPGTVGLVVIDTFAFGVPLMYCADQPHPPEVEYLEDGVNAVHAPPAATPETFADHAVQVLRDPELLERLREGCRTSAETYTIEQMAQNYAEGILAALETPKHT